MAFRIPYTSYGGTKHETLDFIEENSVFDSLGEDLGQVRKQRLPNRSGFE